MSWYQGVVDPSGGLSFGIGLVLTGVVVQLVGRGAASGSIERNSVTGIRTKATQSSDDAWRAGHVAAAPWLSASAVIAGGSGVVTLMLAIALLATGRENPAVLAVPIVGVVVMLGLLVLSTVKANAAARATGPRDA